jgi:hypothetical protein
VLSLSTVGYVPVVRATNSARPSLKETLIQNFVSSYPIFGRPKPFNTERLQLIRHTVI